MPPKNSCAGSSPRVRGTPSRPSSRCLGHRFIPACAGNSAGRNEGLGTASVHPRVCGELLSAVSRFSRSSGSSPRVRGTRPRAWTGSPRARFIPACAGNSLARSKRGMRLSVHPRVCGELASANRACQSPTGSSPRVRGTPSAKRRAAARFPVHPRVCGELRGLQWTREKRDGSSPRVRGTRDGGYVLPVVHRFIPACAGNSSFMCGTSAQPAVHPRVCGELARPLGRRTGEKGSSPRVRGTLGVLQAANTRRRFIPACAGNSADRGGAQARSSVHPRVCGELA